MFGAEKLLADLLERGFTAEIVDGNEGNKYAVIRGYEIELGRFAGRIIDLGIMVTPDYPRSVASAIHIKAEPQLLEKSDTAPNVRNIIDSNLGTEWRYWSHNFNWTTERNTRRLISQINTIFKNA
jgi:hypothetical protein